MEENKAKIVFFGTPLFGAIILEEIIKKGMSPIFVFTQKDKPGDRKKIKIPEVKIIAEKYKIKVFQEEKKKEIYNILKRENIDLIITAAYGKILPLEILNIPKYGSYNIHPSLLPKYRGPSPVQYTILNGDKETGVSIFKMNEKMDEGDIAIYRKIEVSNSENTETLLLKLAFLSSEILLEIIPQIIKESTKLLKQDDSKATYTKIIEKKDGKIDWNLKADQIEKKIRAFYPWPGVFTFWRKNDKEILRIKILEAKVIDKKDNLQIGQVSLYNNGYLLVRCKENSLLVKKIQVEGKKTVESKEFVIGNKNIIGALLE